MSELLFNYYPSNELVKGENQKQFDQGGRSSNNNLNIIYKIVSGNNIKNTLEIGFLFGASAIAILSAQQNKKRIDICTHSAIDPFQKSLWDNAGKITLKKFGFENKVNLLYDYSYNALPQLLKMDKRFDLVYIDGSHLFEDVFIDFYYSHLLLNLNGFLIFDDCSDPHVIKVFKFINKNYSEFYEELSVIGLLEMTNTKKIKYQLAHRLNRTQIRIFKKIKHNGRKWNSKLKEF